MSDSVSEETATQMAREMAAAGMPSAEIIRCLVERGVARGVAVSVVLIRTSAQDRPKDLVGLGNMVAGRPDDGRIIATFSRRWNRQLVAVAVAVVAVAVGALLLVSSAFRP